MIQQKGFTLIELVMVIVILGILASFAVPRFADITVDARKSALRGLEGSLRSGAALAKSTSLVQSKASNASISMEGNTVAMANFYPTASGIEQVLLDTSGFTFTTSGTVATFEKIGATTPASCKVTYTEAAAGSTPTINVTDSDC
jgi:MSHA pilin protein MshA